MSANIVPGIPNDFDPAIENAYLMAEDEAAQETAPTPAVARAARALAEANGWSDLELEELGPEVAEAQFVLNSALDVEEMAQAIDPRAFGPMTRRSSFAHYLGAQRAARDKAFALRAAILGPES